MAGSCCVWPIGWLRWRRGVRSGAGLRRRGSLGLGWPWPAARSGANGGVVFAVFADRVLRYNLPVGVLYSALTQDRATWLPLLPGEVEPQVVDAVPTRRVVWSSFWPVSPDDLIEFDLAPSSRRPQIVRARIVGEDGAR